MNAIVHGSPTSVVGVIRKQFLGPFHELQRLKPAFAATACGGATMGPLDPGQREKNVKLARELLAIIPDSKGLSKAIRLFDQAVEEQATYEQSALVVSALLESFPNKPAGLGTLFFDSFMLMIEEFEDPLSAFTMATAYRRVVTEKTFLPSIDEFLEACEKSRKTFSFAATRTSMLQEIRWSVEDTLEQAGEWKPDFKNFEEIP